MIEYNHNEYIKLIWFLNKFKLCICCKSLIEEKNDQYSMKNKDITNDNNNTSIDTKTVDPIPTSHVQNIDLECSDNQLA